MVVSPLKKGFWGEDFMGFGQVWSVFLTYFFNLTGRKFSIYWYQYMWLLVGYVLPEFQTLEHENMCFLLGLIYIHGDSKSYPFTGDYPFSSRF